MVDPSRTGSGRTSRVGGGLSYHAPLDGLRGLALLAIIVYHSGSTAAPGAFLSVSTFFTLSGFLIGRVLFHEHLRTGGVSLRGFWSRRLRRLMPAALAAIVAIVVAANWLATASQWFRLRSDALASLFYVANWRFILAGDQYGSAFASASPFTHFWTLSIEEQFYVALPVLIFVTLMAARGSRRRAGIAITTLLVGSIAWSNWLVHRGATIDRLYFGTDVRLPELLIGVLAALWWTRQEDPVGPRGAAALRWAGPAALAAMIALWLTADHDDLLFYRGGLTAYSVLTLVVIASGMQSRGVTVRALSWRPLVWVGIVSYAAYLVHFPVLVWLQQHTHLATTARLLVAVAVTFSVAALSGRLLERPIRSGRVLAGAPAGPVGVVAVLGTVAVIFATTTISKPFSRTALDDAARFEQFVKQSRAQEASDAPRIAMYGDSTAFMTGVGMTGVSRRHPDRFVAVAGSAQLGCGLNTVGLRRYRGEEVTIPRRCDHWPEKWARAARAHPADVAVVQLGPWEVVDQQLGTGGPFLTVGRDAQLDEALEGDLRRGVDALLAHTPVVVLVEPPDIEVGRVDGRSPDTSAVESDPARMAAFTRILKSVAADTPRVHLVDLGSWVRRQRDDATLRPDGIHFTDDSAATAASWLGSQLTGIYAHATGRDTTQVPRS